MTPERWKQVERIFDLVIDVPPTDRGAVLDEQCGDDAELRSEVESLLSADKSIPFLDGEAVSYFADIVDVDIATAPNVGVEPGLTLGAWRLLRQIGEGGMSVVFLAERANGEFAQQAAVKVLRHPGGMRGDNANRFHRERAIVAGLDHPNIAHILDGGLADGGWPFLVMEFVDGQPLTEYCALRQLGIGGRLSLFEQICAAVQHAHQRLIVHRDLKPANILVQTGDDGEGIVKLLDFGIAKLLSAGADADTTQTRTGLLPMTPRYAAPEQLRGADVTTATDVYALGLLLYELLAGRPPYDLHGLSASRIETLICEYDAPSPSTLVDDQSTATIPVAPARLRQMLRGDLDAILLKAVARDPVRRYGSARELADDLRRYRNGLPVEAAAPSTLYRAGKFLRRHWLGAAVTSGFVLLTLGFAAAMSVQQRQTERERDRAQLEAAKSGQVADFLFSLFAASEPRAIDATPDNVTARMLLEAGVQQANTLREQPLVRAQMLSLMGSVYRRLGDREAAHKLLAQAVALLTEQSGGDPLELAQAWSEQALLAADRSDYEESERLHRDALQVYVRHTGPDSDEAIREMGRIADSLLGAGRARDAAVLVAEAQRLADARQVEPGLKAQLHRHASSIHAEAGDFALAERHERAALELLSSLHGEDHLETASATANLGYLLARQAKFAEAEPYYRTALETQRNILGDLHGVVVSGTSNLAMLHARAGNYAAAEPWMREVLALQKRVNGEAHELTATAYNNLGVLMDRMGNAAASAEMHTNALRIRRDLFGEHHPSIALSLHNVAFAQLTAGQRAAARQSAIEALNVGRAANGDVHPQTSSTLNVLSMVERELGNVAEAETLAQESLSIAEALYGDEHLAVASALSVLALARAEGGDIADATSLLRRSLSLERALLGDEHPDVARRLHQLASVFSMAGRPQEAVGLLEEALSIEIATLGLEHPKVVATQEAIAAVSLE